MIAPSKAIPIFPSLVEYKDSSFVNKPRGNFYLLSITITEPTAPIPGIAFVGGWIKGDVAVLPQQVLFPKNKSYKQVQAENKKDMQNSQSAAAKAALNLVQREFPDNFLRSKPSYDNVLFDVKKVGGPSAGLVFALSLTELLTKEDLLQGRKVAATGTIDSDGKVGAIGGIDEKLISVARAGASLALIPQSNCRDVTAVPRGVTVVPIATLDEAVQVLLGKKAPRTCTNLGA